jgi:hypothetical protein
VVVVVVVVAVLVSPKADSFVASFCGICDEFGIGAGATVVSFTLIISGAELVLETISGVEVAASISDISGVAERRLGFSSKVALNGVVIGVVVVVTAGVVESFKEGLLE